MFTDKYNTTNEFSWNKLEEISMLFNKNNWTSLSCLQYLNNQSFTEKTVVVRVDVDRSINKSLKMAKIFKKYNINATFFFRLHSQYYNILSFQSMKTLHEIEKMGFEIGLHSETVDLYSVVKKDPKKLLENDIQILNSLIEKPIYGVASHGDNSGLNNLDFWKFFNPEDFGLLYEAYDKRKFNLFNNSIYVSDSLITRWKVYEKGNLINSELNNIKEFLLNYNYKEPCYLLLHPFIFRENHFFEDF